MHPALRRAAALSFLSVLIGTSSTWAESSKKHEHEHGHHHEMTEQEQKIYSGYFEDDQVKDRPLSDWDGHWQSVYPYLENGTLDPVMAQKAESGNKTAEEYRAYYETGYKTDVDWISIEGNEVTFFKQGEPSKATYESDGYEILTYAKGNRGVRFIFKKTSGDDHAPKFFQFSDHSIAPVKAHHFHIYFGDDRAKLLEEVTNWPTFYPFSLNGEQIVEEMLAH